MCKLWAVKVGSNRGPEAVRKAKKSNFPEAVVVGIKLKVSSRAFRRYAVCQKWSLDAKVISGQSLLKEKLTGPNDDVSRWCGKGG
jgi:hypothetical protein